MADLLDVSDDDCRNKLRMDHNNPLCVGVGQDSGKGKAPRGRRSCTRVEEDALIHCLTDIVNDGWKAENSFKAGF
ncbi:hypothetical protein ACS0TY_011578 [Phlomoides rotata]